MAMKGVTPHSPDLKPHYWMQSRVILKAPLIGDGGGCILPPHQAGDVINIFLVLTTGEYCISKKLTKTRIEVALYKI